ncbi:MAG TPA: ABC transporter substrate-binding protein [Xanthobacteraceae bacterium]|jgi:putative ABC transport system substrate-binding protein
MQLDRLGRRDFIALLGGATAWPLSVRAQQTRRSAAHPRVAFLGAESFATNHHFLDAFREGMREHGYVDGQNMTLVDRWAEGRSERFPELVGELVDLKVDIILAISLPAALAAKNATSTVPIVFIASDPRDAGLVPSLARPGGNLTGVSLSLGDEFSSKWLEILKEAVPSAVRVGVLSNAVNPASAHYLTVLGNAAQKLGLTLQPVAVSDPAQFDSAFAALAAERSQALVVVTDPLTLRYRDRVVELTIENRLPTMYGFREFADAGGLMAYGVNVPDLCRAAAVYVDKILKGAKPADLPIEQPTKLKLVINLKAAKALGLEIPPMLLARSDEIIE